MRHPVEDCLDTLTFAEFEILEHGNSAVNDDAVSWSFPLTGELRYARTPRDHFTVLRSSTIGRTVPSTMCAFLEKVGILVSGITQVTKFLGI